MNLVDLIILSSLCFYLIRGVFTGLIRELFSLTGVLAGFMAASTCYLEVAKSLSRWTSDASKIKILSFLSIFFGFLLAISILGRAVKFRLKIDFLSGVDSTFGASVSVIKGILIVSVLLLTLTAFLPKKAAIIKNSLFSPRLTVVSEKMSRMVSKDMRHEFLAKISVYKKAWEKNK
jgi:membrane protein required for colicin V production